MLSISLLLLALAAQNDGGFEIVGTTDSGLGAGASWTDDVNGDGVPDLLIGALGLPVGGPDTGMVEVRSGADGSLIRRDFGPAGFFLGSFLLGIHDVDGDGFGDYAAGTGDWGVLGPFGSGVIVYSGATGVELWRFDARVYGEEIGQRMENLADINGDGIDDLLLSGSTIPDGMGGSIFRGGEILILSGADGTLLREHRGSLAGQNFGTAIGLAGDLNLDGFEDYIAGSSNQGPFGEVEVFSGADGSLLWSKSGNGTTGPIGQFVTSTGDVNGDGIPDIVTSLSSSDMQCYSGADGSALWSDPMNRPALAIQIRVNTHLVGDYNQDGIPEIGSTIGYLGVPQFLRILDGATGETFTILGMRRVNGMPDQFAEDFSGLPDLNGDGLEDLLIGRPRHAIRPHVGSSGFDYNDDGQAFIQFMRPFLSTSATELSASGGSSVVLDIDFPASEAGRGYTMLVSAAGRYDAILGNQRKYAPMGRDLLFSRMESGYVPAFGFGFHGVLDANGDASTTLDQGFYLAEFVGRSMHFAAVTHGGFPLVPESLSNAVVLKITP
ncbi:MAG: hypothetical protein COA70_10045 [Planctomycetota bacterium]|nr:MAG: hypothetical protein COA70_10045 [Planctomycetota bacterium]